jgi:3-hydroxyisobutyrate dehydrogenase
MGGGIAAARTATLQLFVGGDGDTVRRHRPLLEALGEIRHVGGLGAGYTVKLLVNLLWFTQALATGEALLLAQRSGIDLDVLHGALSGSAADSRFIARDLEPLLSGDYLTTFGLDRCVEELEAIVALARTHELDFELSTLVRDLHARALQRYGPVDGELLGIALLEEQAHTRLRHPHA